MSREITLTEQNFEAEGYCGPTYRCSLTIGHLGADRATSSRPVINQIAAERRGTLKVGNVNVDEQPLLAAARACEGSLRVLYRDGREAAQAVALNPSRRSNARSPWTPSHHSLTWQRELGPWSRLFRRLAGQSASEAFRRRPRAAR